MTEDSVEEQIIVLISALRQHSPSRIPSRSRDLSQERSKIMGYCRQRYERDGWSIRKITRKLNVSYGFIHDLLMKSGVKLRPRGRAALPIRAALSYVNDGED